MLEGAGHEVAKLWYPVPHDTPAFALELLRLVGVPASQIVVYGAEEVIRPDVLLMPNLLHNGVRFSPLLRQAVALFKRGLRRQGAWSEAPRTPARIFLARSGRNRRLVNRDRIEAMAQEARFTLVRPENLSLPEQFALFAGAREIIGEYGSAFHTAMFSPPDTVICGLRGDEGHPAFIQSGIGEVLEQPTGYVFGASGTGAGRHDYTVPEDVFAGCLKFAFGVGANLARSRPLADSSAPAEPVAAPSVVQREAPSGIRRFLPWGPKPARGAAPLKENLLDGLLEPGADKTRPERMRWPRE